VEIGTDSVPQLLDGLQKDGHIGSAVDREMEVSVDPESRLDIVSCEGFLIIPGRSPQMIQDFFSVHAAGPLRATVT